MAQAPVRTNEDIESSKRVLLQLEGKIEKHISELEEKSPPPTPPAGDSTPIKLLEKLLSLSELGRN